MRSIVIGKFYPPHLGHKYLIDYATANSDHVTVLVCDSPAYTIAADVRRMWLQQIHPTVTVRIIPDIDDDDNSKRWAAHTLEFLGYTPDAVFSSESYGKPYAAFMNTTHHMVDQKRTHVPISATRVRADMYSEWQYLHPIVKADLAKRIVVVGAESTGTTTLARAIAAKLHTPWVPEYGRLYSDAISTSNHAWSDADFAHIASQQQVIERQLAAASQGMVVCDTNATATQLWQKFYVGATTDDVTDVANKDIVDLYIITDDDIPFVQDGTRATPRRRRLMQQAFITHIARTGAAYVIVRGSRGKRLASSLESIESLSHNFS